MILLLRHLLDCRVLTNDVCGGMDWPQHWLPWTIVIFGSFDVLAVMVLAAIWPFRCCRWLAQLIHVPERASPETSLANVVPFVARK